ncbi:hypothetical protein AB1L42_05630 [Thalassoglobus sp. JC818]|uniref:hypothetical protein n=1 Tax=Thalassoglobus sp. JC818 TaxID=3232136 RepID=UPI0034576183
MRHRLTLAFIILAGFCADESTRCIAEAQEQVVPAVEPRVPEPPVFDPNPEPIENPPASEFGDSKAEAWNPLWSTQHLHPIVGPSVSGGYHYRYPYYSYRRPWFPAGPASRTVDIVW